MLINFSINTSPNYLCRGDSWLQLTNRVNKDTATFLICHFWNFWPNDKRYNFSSKENNLFMQNVYYNALSGYLDRTNFSWIVIKTLLLYTTEHWSILHYTYQWTQVYNAVFAHGHRKSCSKTRLGHWTGKCEEFIFKLLIENLFLNILLFQRKCSLSVEELLLFWDFFLSSSTPLSLLFLLLYLLLDQIGSALNPSLKNISS